MGCLRATDRASVGVFRRFCNGPLPLEQMLVLFGQAAKGASLDRVVLRILDPSLDLALVTGHSGPGREDDRTVMLCELLELGVEPRVIKVRIDDPRLEVVDHDGGGNGSEGSEGVFEVPDEVLGRLPRCGPCGSGSGLRETNASGAACPPRRSKLLARSRLGARVPGRTPCV